jgi:hypothetical protein
VLSLRDIGWVAGLFEGEGSILAPSQAADSMRLTIAMTDLDVLWRYAVLVGATSLHGPYQWQSSVGHKGMYRVTIYGSRAAALGMTIYPLLGERRQAKMKQALLEWRQGRAMGSAFCPYGHRKTGEGRKRRCLECAHQNSVKRAVQQKAERAARRATNAAR